MLGIDQGPILLMIENYRAGSVWRRFMRSDVIQRGLERAGFRELPMPRAQLHPQWPIAHVNLLWTAEPGFEYQVLYSPDLRIWTPSPTGRVRPETPIASWTDTGPPSTEAPPGSAPVRFYQVRPVGMP